MTNYQAPGVYVEEVPGTPPIVGVGTSTAGFIGRVANDVDMPPIPGRFQKDSLTGEFVRDENGNLIPEHYTVAPAGEAQLITNWEQFKTKFGDFQHGNRILAHAVYGFFNNGGTRCHVIRVADLGEDDGVRQALKTFEAIDEIAIVAVPGALDDAIQLQVIEHCEKMEDRIALLDGQQTRDIRVDTIKGPVRNSPKGYAALYFPRIQVSDPVDGGRIFVPPSGHMAGIYARVDAERGVHKAPANVVVRGALGLEYLVSRNEQEGLNPDGINVIRSFNGDIRVWGARTLGGDDNGEMKYINVRRLMSFLRDSIEQGTRFAVFEPNTPALWKRITRSVSAFLTVVWRDGALFGNTPEQAFYVKCDETTNPEEVRNLGQVVTEIGVAIVRPAEFVIFRIAQSAGPAA